MRLEILNSGYRPGAKLLFAVIRLFSGQPVPDAAKLVFYRPDFYGTREVLSAGVSPQQIEDALAVCVAFNTTDRLADTFGFELLSPEGFESGAKYLLKRGYR